MKPLTRIGCSNCKLLEMNTQKHLYHSFIVLFNFIKTYYFIHLLQDIQLIHQTWKDLYI